MGLHFAHFREWAVPAFCKAAVANVVPAIGADGARLQIAVRIDVHRALRGRAAIQAGIGRQIAGAQIQISHLLDLTRIGQMRLWLWEFLLWAAKEWNLVQDVQWWAIDTLPTSGTNRNQGLLRQSVKMCIWLGSPDCYRNQEAVLWEPSDRHAARKWSDRALHNRPSGHTVRDGRTAQTSALRGGSVPFNLLPIANSNTNGSGKHPASTPYELASWWCRYILPQRGVLLDPFVGSGGMLSAALDNGASKVIGIDKEKKYLTTAKRRVRQV